MFYIKMDAAFIDEEKKHDYVASRDGRSKKAKEFREQLSRHRHIVSIQNQKP